MVFESLCLQTSPGFIQSVKQKCRHQFFQCGCMQIYLCRIKVIQFIHFIIPLLLSLYFQLYTIQNMHLKYNRQHTRDPLRDLYVILSYITRLQKPYNSPRRKKKKIVYLSKLGLLFARIHRHERINMDSQQLTFDPRGPLTGPQRSGLLHVIHHWPPAPQQAPN